MANSKKITPVKTGESLTIDGAAPDTPDIIAEVDPYTDNLLVDDTEEAPDLIEEKEAEKEPEKEADKNVEISTDLSISIAPDKLMKVRPKHTYTTSIGGTWYSFVAGEIFLVPENVKRIMAEGDMLLPL